MPHDDVAVGPSCREDAIDECRARWSACVALQEAAILFRDQGRPSRAVMLCDPHRQIAAAVRATSELCDLLASRAGAGRERWARVRG